jgi:adenine-specific DNA-methyltransferase
LLERVVEACCPADGVVADFFCGSGTAVVAAEKLGRGWIACDESAEAVRLTRERLERETK